MNKDTMLKALQLIGLGYSKRKAAKELGIPKSTLSDALRGYSSSDTSLPATTVLGMPLELNGKSPRVLLIDLETAPCKGYYWNRWKENIYQEKVISEGFILTVTASWLLEDTWYTDALTNEEVQAEDDKRLVAGVWDLLNNADIVIAQNGKRFDIPLLNTRFVFHDMSPPLPYKVVDTLEIAKKTFRFPSNSLDSMAVYMGLGQKLKHEGFGLWRRVMENDTTALQEMLEYNIVDVELLKKVYLKLRAWDAKAPNMAVYYEDTQRRCVCCGSTDLSVVTEKSAYTSLSEFEIMRCNSCGKPARARRNKFTKEKMQAHLQNIVN